MKCAECNLWGADHYGDILYCHADPNWPAPCEYEEESYDFEEDTDDFDEWGFDPYEGCYTYDC